MNRLLKQFEELSDNAQTLMEGWMEQVGPKLEEFGPIFEGLAEKIDDLSAYHPPEVLENGDIIIRRKPKDAPETSKQDLQKGEIIDL